MGSAERVNLHANVTRQPAQISLLPSERKHERAYREHRAAHPEVFDRLVALARSAKARGWSRIGMRTLWEVLRWRRGAMKPKDDAGFHMNDWYAPFYARDIMRECDDLAGMFELRGRS